VLRTAAPLMAPAVALALWAGVAVAGTWTVVPERSEISFEYRLDGTPREGRFRRFSGGGRFAEEETGTAELSIRIESDSIDLGNRLVSAYATSAEWFDSRNHPAVTYRLTELTRTGPDAYEATGEITLLGRSETLSTPLRLSIENGQAHARGRLEIDRRSFGLGVGLSDLIVDVGPLVAVRFDLVADPDN